MGVLWKKNYPPVRGFYSTPNVRLRRSNLFDCLSPVSGILEVCSGEEKDRGDVVLYRTRLHFFFMGGCGNCGPFLGPYYNTAPII